MKQILRDASATPSLWHRRDVQIAIPARALSYLGDELTMFTLVLFAYAHGWGATGVATIFTVGALPLSVASPWAGRIVDQYDSRRVTAIASALQTVTSVFIALVMLASVPDQIRFPTVLVLLGLLGLTQAVAGPAWQALIPHLVEEPDVPKLVALNQTLMMVAFIGASALGGAFFALAGAAPALIADATTFGLLTVAALALRTRRTPEPTTPGERLDLWAGFRVMAIDAVLGPVALGVTLLVLTAQLVIVVEVFMIRDTLHGSNLAYGVVMALLGVALVPGSLVSARIRAEQQLVVSLIAQTGLAFTVLLSGLAPNLILYAMAMMMLGFFNGLLNASSQVLVLTRTTDDVRGRVGAAFSGLTQAASLIGLPIGGALASAFTPRQIFIGAGVTSLTVCLTVAAWAMARRPPEITSDGPAPTPSPVQP